MQGAALCALTYYIVSAALNKADSLLESYCLTNNQQPSGQNCILMAGAAANAASGSCLGKLLQSATCNVTTCQPTILNFTQNLGCCGYYIAQMTSATGSPLPSVPGFTATYSQLFPAATLALLTTSGFAFFQTCPALNSTAALANLTTKCSGLLPGQQAPQKKLPLGLAWSSMSGNATLQAILQVSLQQDIAQQIGVTQDCILNGTLAQDTTRTITVNSSAHGMHAMATTSTASTYNYAIVASTPSATAAASAAADSKTNSGQMTLTQTSSTVSSSCSNCTAASTPGTPPSSGAFGFTTTSAAPPMYTAALIAAVMVAALL